ncbi:phosphatase PAP2 family protein [Candidatus Woesearchaeota archaeon]|nr:MAG: phosphatase PAP2 family protein [Candidatus Woesearchaeota archaeon]
MMNLVREFFENLTALGSMIFHGIALVFLLFIDFTLFLKLLIALGISTVIVATIRFFYFKYRPLDKEKPKKFLHRLNASSFPSLHAPNSIIFALIVGLTLSTGLFVLLLILTVLIIYSRYYLKKHFIIDLAVGSVLGMIIGLIVALY